MHPFLSRMKHRSAFLGLLLVLSLLFTQWLGYAHALAHVGGPVDVATSTESQSADGLFEHAKSAGACAAFDAATLDAGLHQAGATLLPALLAERAVALPLRAGWHRLFHAHFSSRAPPLYA